ncbi:DUF4352 domain-containing protein [Lactiplantibacillus garii]|uniref:DUF4352 domain-containing protein n=1 Tax=Lactiplantibacillus garii TaxID=2306423 RepID=A0A426D3R5_9LACO|nr:DUF4352 domain-containing protein [Lactiplantibacillus garii]RRK09236.1 DUF4352 domain-containing protein [Lactiplantibacillus garii]
MKTITRVGLVTVLVTGIGTGSVFAAQKRTTRPSTQQSNASLQAGALKLNHLKNVKTQKSTVNGQRQVTFHVNISNSGQTEVVLSGSNFRLQSHGKTYYAQNAATINLNSKQSNHSFFFETLHAHRMLTGTVIFDVPNTVLTDQQTQLIFTNSPFGKQSQTLGVTTLLTK